MVSKGRETTNEHEFFTVRDEWEQFGLTNHIGGIKTTQQLIEWCGIASGQYVLASAVRPAMPPAFSQKNIRRTWPQ